MKNKKIFFSMLMFSVLAIVTCHQRPYGQPMGYRDHMMGNYGIWGVLMWLLILVLVGIAIYFFISYNKQSGFPGRGAAAESPLDILKKRYARGEITREEFEEMKRQIES